MPRRLELLVATSVLLAACAEELEPVDDGEPGDGRVPWEATSLPLPPSPPDNPTTPEKVELGRLLFHDPILSSDGTVACLTCHSPVWGMGDGLPVSVGIGGVGPIGTGRTGPNTTRRNSQTLWNVAYRESLFWDGRASSLEEQVRFPLDDPAELGRPFEALVADLRNLDEYVALFEAAFPERAEPITAETIRMAIAAFQRTVVSDNAPYDQFVAGDDAAMGESEVRGMFLFGELGCAGCHVPPSFDSERFEPVLEPRDDDLGRFEVTGDEGDRHRVRVPTLRNARETRPYFHNGAVASLDEAIALEVGARGLRALSADDLTDLVAFIEKSLIDKSRAPRRPETVPSGLEVPLDGYRIPR